MKTLILFSLFFFFNITNGQIKVNLTQGQVTGFNKPTLDRNLSVFLGIPYARPPVNEFRFHLPQPLNTVRDVDARKWPNPCMQYSGDTSDLLNPNFSEDCLYLNIWSPNMTGKLPVLVWIHGGGFTMGSSVQELYDGDVMSAKTNTVLVSINYRLNMFGFLSSSQSDMPGNLGLMDQVMALKWVKNNIVKFGGDPKQVTIFGESAGGVSVNSHFISPASRGLFRHAIAQSSGSFIKMTDPVYARMLSLALAKTVGCVKNETEFTESVKKCLRNLTANEFYKKGGIQAFNFMALTHGEGFFPKPPNELVKAGYFQSKSSLLVGTMEDEGSFLLPMFDPVRFNKTRNSYNLTKAEAFESLKNISQLLFPLEHLTYQQVYNLYLASAPNKPDAIRRAVGNFFGDLLLSCQTMNFARLVYQHQPTKSNNSVYHYFYTHKYSQSLNESFQNICSDWMGACHTQDLYSVFGRPFKYPQRYNAREKVLTERMMKTFSLFARTGKPAPINGIQWPKYYSVGNQTAMPYYEFATSERPMGNFGSNLNQFKCQVLAYD